MTRRSRGSGRRLQLIIRGTEPRQTGKLFEELALPVLDDLYRLACRFETDPVRAEDLLQEALLTGFRKFHQLENHRSFRAWISKILRRTFLNRRSGKFESLPLEEGTLDAVTDPLGDADPYDPERRLLARRLSRELKEALDRLPQEQRLAILVIDVQGFSYAEAADVLEVAPGTVASRVARGRAALRRFLNHLARERGWVES